MPADADEARRAAEEVLRGSEYQEPGRSWLQTTLEKVDEWFSRLFTSLGGTGGSPVVGWLVVILAAVTATVAVVLAVRSIRRDRRASGAAEEEDGSALRRRRRPIVVDWDEEAERLEAEGRWRDGLRARYRALIGELTTRKVVDPAASRTTGEHRREVGTSAPDAAGEFDAAAELFDRAWYGNRPTGPEEAERFRELARRVEERAR